MQNLHFLNAGGRLAPFEVQISSAFRDGIEKVRAKLSLPSVDVVVMDNPDAAIPETGVGGFAPTAHLLHISINPGHPDLSKSIDAEFKSALAHELHHCARWATIGYGNTLLEACVSEGLADHFDIEVNGGKSKPWSIAIQDKELEVVRSKAEHVFNEKYDEGVWFWGVGEVPRWAAYSLGFDIVKKYKERTRRTAAELVGENANLFVASVS